MDFYAFSESFSHKSHLRPHQSCILKLIQCRVDSVNISLTTANADKAEMNLWIVQGVTCELIFAANSGEIETNQLAFEQR